MESIATPTLIQVDILGPVRIRFRNAPCETKAALLRQFPDAAVTEQEVTIERFPRRITAGVLGYLAYRLGDRCDRDTLITAFWPEQSTASGRNSLSLVLTAMRRLINGDSRTGPLETDRNTVRLIDQNVVTDLHEFDELLALVDGLKGERTGSRELSRRVSAVADAQAARQLCERAVRLYRGPLLAGFEEEWLLGARARMQERYLMAVRQLVALCRAEGDLAGALDAVHHAVAAEPHDEETHRLLLTLLMEAGQPDLAVRRYRAFERLLRQSGELALNDEMPAELVELYQTARRRVDRRTRQSKAVDPDHLRTTVPFAKAATTSPKLESAGPSCSGTTGAETGGNRGPLSPTDATEYFLSVLRPQCPQIAEEANSVDTRAYLLVASLCYRLDYRPYLLECAAARIAAEGLSLQEATQKADALTLCADEASAVLQEQMSTLPPYLLKTLSVLSLAIPPFDVATACLLLNIPTTLRVLKLIHALEARHALRAVSTEGEHVAKPRWELPYLTTGWLRTNVSLEMVIVLTVFFLYNVAHSVN